MRVWRPDRTSGDDGEVSAAFEKESCFFCLKEDNRPVTRVTVQRRRLTLERAPRPSSRLPFVELRPSTILRD